MKTIFTFFLSVLSVLCFAQKESWHWYFGGYAGIDFSSGSAVVTTNGALSNYEGCASISDSTGALLFYTDGLHVYDRSHVLMPNGSGLFGHPSSSQSSIIVKLPGSSTIYYIFTVDYNVGSNGFCYSIVDMTLNGGMGDVTQKNIQIRTPVYEKVTAVKHGNNSDYWILINDWVNDDIYSYEFTSAGLNMNPVISGTGPFHNLWIGATGGYIKANRQGNKIVLAMWDKNSFDICDFDNTTGLASNHLVVQSADMVYTYGVEFSPDGTYLYGTNMDPPSHLYQFDLTSGTAAGILASRITLGSSSILYHYSALQIAPDGKIYCAHRNDLFIGAIDHPDSSGFQCNYVDNALNLSPGFDYLGLPNYPADYVLNNSLLPAAGVFADQTLCPGTCADFLNLSLNAVSYQWTFTGANPDTSTEVNPTNICYANAGSYDIQLIATNALGSDTLLLVNYITVFPQPAPQSILQNGDTLFANQGAVTYQWYQNGIILIGATNFYYVISEGGNYNVICTDTNGCEVEAAIFDVIASIPLSLGEGLGVRLYPNPVTETFSINGYPGYQEISIYNVMGEKIYTDAYHNEALMVDCSALSSGIYFVEITTSEKSFRAKFVKK